MWVLRGVPPVGTLGKMPTHGTGESLVCEFDSRHPQMIPEYNTLIAEYQ